MATKKNNSRKNPQRRSSSARNKKAPQSAKKRPQTAGRKPSGASKPTNTSRPSSSSAPKRPANTKAAETAAKSTGKKDSANLILFALSALFFFLTTVEGENLWFDLHSLILGMFGQFSILWAAFFLYASVISAYKSPEISIKKRFFSMISGIVIFSTFWYIFFSSSLYHDGSSDPSYFKILSSCYTDGSHGYGSSVVPALFGGLFCIAFGVTGAKIFISIVAFVYIMALTGYKLDFIYRAWQSVSNYFKSEVNETKKLIKTQKHSDNKKINSERPTPSSKINRFELFEERNFQEEQNDTDFVPPPAEQFNYDPSRKGKSPGYIAAQASASSKPSFDINVLFEDDDEDNNSEEAFTEKLNQKLSAEIPYDEEESRKSIKAILGIDEIEDTDDEKDFFDEDDGFDLDKIFDRKKSAENKKSDYTEKADNKNLEKDNGEYLTQTDNGKSNAAAISDDPFKVMEVAKGELTEEDGNYYRYPPISLLSKPSGDDAIGVTPDLRANGELLVQTLKSFGVSTRIVNICRGPAITRYELQPSAGVKISKITNLADDIALNLAASAVRIEAPIPGKPAVGIEIPNKKVSVVKAREIIDTNEFNLAKSKLTVALGKDINGDAAFADLAKMPHLLIAGATGSGKSVCINSIIVSLLYKSSPEEVKLLMIDPKVVELGVYNGIPHLLVPVVTDPKKAAGALAWAVTEMLKRYNTFAENNVRDIFGYNEYAEQNNLKKLEQVVIIIDELADLMMVAPKEVEDSVCRLAQMARAAGMYLIIATQRPSVDIITGVIKANIPSRIAFAVSSQVDSRTILDSGGAEKLIGRGDMLFVPMGASKPKRIQGCFISDKEIEQIAEFVKSSHETEYNDEVSSEIDRQAELAIKPKKGGKSDDDGGGGFDLEDEALMQAIEFVVDAGQASTSMLQRRLRVGYARAGRLIDEMENMGIVGPHEGSKPRMVLITKAQYLEMKMRRNDNKTE